MPLTQTHLRFKQIRTTLGFNQADFAHHAHLKQSQVSQIETGTRELTENIISLLEANLSVNRNWLLNGVGDTFTGEHIPLTPGPVTEWPQTTINAKINSKEAIDQANRFKFFREQERISTDQMANELSIQKPALNKYENAKLQIPTSAIVYLHNKYQMSYDWFFDGSGNRKVIPGEKGTSNITAADLYETQTILVAKIDYLEKQLKQERAARKKLQADINKLSLQIS